ncbi:unnamed protein product [Cylicocyclus nassatus]|uniref:RING-type domain-containing protein n=1 Tax=Cylicocyclus nassatus TaxID=53992 RepID=A0AA36GSF9_CYLNA|nr:unnamed protein product [Cylicocyclus nassatus]
MLRNLVGSLRRRARSVAAHEANSSKTPTETMRENNEAPILVTIQRMVDKCAAEDSDEQEASCSDDACCVCLSRVATVHAYPCGHKISCRLCASMMLKASAKAQEKHFRCIMCRSNVYRLRYVRPDPVIVLCKPEAPFALRSAHPGEMSSLSGSWSRSSPSPSATSSCPG